MPKSWWERLTDKELEELEKEARKMEKQYRLKEKFKGIYILTGPGGKDLQFLFYEEPSGRIRYDAFLDEEFIEEGYIDGDRVMDEIAERCYKALQETRKELGKR